MRISELVPNPNNPRLIKDEKFKKLCESIKSFPKMMKLRPIVIDDQNIILGGNMRYRALQSLGYTELDEEWVKKADGLTEEEKQEFIIKDNNEFGEYDFDILANNFDVEDLLRWGMDEKDLRIEKMIEEDDVPDVSEEEPIAKLGDIYQLGSHRVMCGDSTSEVDVSKLMDGKRASMAFTDPPYNVDYTGGKATHEKNTRSGILNDKMSKADFYQFLLQVNNRLMENVDGGIYICMSSSELDTLKMSFEEAGGHWQSFIIWVKDNFTLSRADYQHLYEPILYGWSSKVKNHYFIENRDIPNVWESLDKIKSTFDGENTLIKFHGFEVKIKGKVTGEVKRKKQRNDIWRYDKPTKSEEHPTMKPVRLCAEAVRNSCKPEQIVLDLFGGSGSTLIACEQLNRKCFMMELDCKYIDVIIKRWENITGQKAEKIND